MTNTCGDNSISFPIPNPAGWLLLTAPACSSVSWWAEQPSEPLVRFTQLFAPPAGTLRCMTHRIHITGVLSSGGCRSTGWLPGPVIFPPLFQPHGLSMPDWASLRTFTGWRCGGLNHTTAALAGAMGKTVFFLSTETAKDNGTRLISDTCLFVYGSMATPCRRCKGRDPAAWI